MALTARIIKGGALLEDSRRFVEAWDSELDDDANLALIAERNLLAKPSASRAEDVIAVLRRRFLTEDGRIIGTLRVLARNPRAFRDACFYEASRDDELLGFFASELLFERWHAGMLDVGPRRVIEWLDQLAVPWATATRKRVAEGLLAAGRDFGLLDGAVHKTIAGPSITLVGFAYAAMRERAIRGSSRALVDAPAWRRFLLTQDHVETLFREADRHKVLRFLEAGSTVRIDWLVEDLREVADVPVA